MRDGTLRGVVHHVYILASASGVLYTGVTSYLERRVAQHKRGLCDGFTKEYEVKRLVYFEGFGDVRDAISREKQIKRWREKKLALIRRMNPKFRILARSLHVELAALSHRPKCRCNFATVPPLRGPALTKTERRRMPAPSRRDDRKKDRRTQTVRGKQPARFGRDDRLALLVQNPGVLANAHSAAIATGAACCAATREGRLVD